VVRTHAVRRQSAVESRFEAPRTATTPLVGRDEEMALLARRWEEAKAGEGQIVLISGEPGIGKSRLTQTMGGAAWGRACRKASEKAMFMRVSAPLL
jgi:predicted ATP-dependent serine protease